MNEENDEMLFDLLTKKAVYGLDEAEQSQLDELDTGTAETELESLEVTAAAISMAGLSIEEPLPAHLYERIAADAAKFVGTAETEAETPWPPSYKNESHGERPGSSWFGWFGWAAAAAACTALAVNIWFTQFQPPVEVAREQPRIEVPQILTPAQMRDELIRSTPGIIRANWAAGNVKEIKQIIGDVVWSDEKQAGYIQLRGLPIKTAPEYCYQLWIFDKVQDKATPIDGGTFDVTEEGEVIIPINAKLKTNGPQMFALTIERHGGVVVSKREKIAALAKVEAGAS